MSDLECPFCQRLGHLDAIPGDELVWRFPHSIALLGTWQYYQGYCVLVARKHARELFELADEVRRAYLEEMCLLARAIHTTYQPLKLNYELLGNQVPHLHWHVFPRQANDPARLSPVWLALDQADHDPARKRELQHSHEERQVTVQRLRTALSELGAREA